MIYVLLGTKAQLIKMAPLMKYFQDHGIPYRFVSTGQHRATMEEILANFQLPPPDIRLYDGPDVTSIGQMLLWGGKILGRTLLRRRKIFPGDKNSLVLVHGDTFSTLLGALMGRLAGLKVGHVESGLRSFDLFHPFPEEITRLLTFRLSQYYFCPGEWAVENLRKNRGIKINTLVNTLYESLQAALPAIERIQDVAIPEDPYGVVTLHRYENVYRAEALARVVELVERMAHRFPLLFILHKPTALNLKKFGFYARLEEHPHIELRPRYDYFRFIKLIKNAHFVVSDGGSNQEECYYLGKPIILLRKSTERNEGLGKNCVLSRYDPVVVEKFLDHIEAYRHTFTTQEPSPCRIIAASCLPFAG